MPPQHIYKHVGIDLPELIRLKQAMTTAEFQKSWNVGIDLPELIRLKPRRLPKTNADWLRVGIDLPELIRLKHLTHVPNDYLPLRSRDWSAWIDTIETTVPFPPERYISPVGIDLPELIRLKLKLKVQYVTDLGMSGLICLNWYDWNT